MGRGFYSQFTACHLKRHPVVEVGNIGADIDEAIGGQKEGNGSHERWRKIIWDDINGLEEPRQGCNLSGCSGTPRTMDRLPLKMSHTCYSLF